MDKINLIEKFKMISDYWDPKIAGELNGQQVKLAKFKGPFIWHKHDEEDEFFMVIEGSFNMELRDKTITLNPGEFIIIPKGTEHRPVAENEALVMMFEPASTLNTGDQQNDMTIDKLDWV
jgi:mannose-6-phosphate isomerase-like protein (cupin superfamily)